MDINDNEDVIQDECEDEMYDQVSLLPSVIFPRFKERNRSFHHAIMNGSPISRQSFKDAVINGGPQKFLDDSRRKSKYNWKIFLPFAPRSSDPNRHVMDDCGFFSTMTISWATPMIKKAFKSLSDVKDLGMIPSAESAEVCQKRFQRLWRQELLNKGPQEASLMRVLIRGMRTRLIVSLFILLLSMMCLFIGPAFLIRSILEYIEQPDKPLMSGLLILIAIVVNEFGRSWLMTLNFFVGIRTGTRCRAVVFTMVYDKLSKLRNVMDKSVGELVNLCANDSQRIFEGVSFGNFIFAGPILLIAAIIYTTVFLGWSAFVGCCVYFLFYPIQGCIARMSGRLRGQCVRVTDQRVRLMNEILTCIKLIKMYAWEGPFSRTISGIRNEERKVLAKAALLQSVNFAVSAIVPVLATVVTFVAHVLSGKSMTASQAFTVISVFNSMQFTLGILPFAIKGVAESSVACKRLKSLLLMEELEPYTDDPDNPKVALEIQNGNFSWDKVELKIAEKKPKTKAQNKSKSEDEKVQLTKQNGNSNHSEPEVEFAGNGKKAEKPANGAPPGGGKPGGPAGGGRGFGGGLRVTEIETKLIPTLYDINLHVYKGSLIGICGGVGAGKSSLVYAMLGQMRKTQGHVAIGGSVAYVSQQAWIMNATVRDNILFGKGYQETLYKKCIKACSLEQDLCILTDGDQTEVGERGINLSGGQKQRISLARALYANRDVYFLDDPLSAVDSHVGQHIFHHCIRGALNGKTVIFVTHQLQYLSQCDQVLYVHNGRIAESGTYPQLMREKKDFADLIEQYYSKEKEKEKDTKDTDDDLASLLDGLVGQMTRKRTLSQSSEDTNHGGYGRQVSNISQAGKYDRQLSNTSKTSEKPASAPQNADGNKDEPAKLIKAEGKAEGSVQWHTYKQYITAAGGFIMVGLMFFFLLWCTLTKTFVDWWLSYWLQQGSGTPLGNGTTVEQSLDISAHPQRNFFVLIYSMGVVAFFIFLIVKAVIFIKVTLKASSKLHDSVFLAVVRSPMSFFDTTPTGRVLNRFSKDLDEIDSRLPWLAEAFLQNISQILVTIVLIGVVFPWFLLCVFPLGVVFYFLNGYFRVAVRELKRLDNVTRSPVFSHITATVQGLATLHAYGKTREFNEKFKILLDNNTIPFFMFNVANRWLAVRLDIITIVITIVTALLVILTRGEIPPALAGLALSYAIRMTGLFQFTVRLSAETEARFTSVERMDEYNRDLIPEAPSIIEDDRPQQGWPKEGKIQFKGVKMRYRDDLPLVLKGITCLIKPQEKIGIVGRTGSGKSSIGITLFRLVEPCSGSIIVDGIDIGKIGLDDLRSKLAIIPQDPVLFIGTVRYNLDPFNEKNDEEIWNALEQAHMNETIGNLPMKLEAPVVENGENFSVGERQLICMARALLRNSKILMLDEATAAIDSKTDNLIQDTIHHAFKHCTLLTIAHRLNTILTSDRIMVLDEGEIVEFDTPDSLTNDPDSVFSSMLKASEMKGKH